MALIFLIFSPTNYMQIPHPPFSTVLLPCLGSCIHSLSSRKSPVQSHSSHQQSQPHHISPTSFPSSFRCRSFHLLQMLSPALLQEIRVVIPVHLRRVRTTRSSTINTISKFHYLIHDLCPTLLLSSFVGALYRPP